MGGHSGQTTNPALLKQVANWSDRNAWMEMFEKYDPFIRKWCGIYGLLPDVADDLVQRIWMELARRLQTYCYDPTKSFRGWLRNLIHMRALDALRERKAARTLPFAEEKLESLVVFASVKSKDDEESEEGLSERAISLEIAARAQANVKKRASGDHWQAFWLIGVEEWPVRQVAELQNKKYAAVYMNYKRILKQLVEEGRRLWCERFDPETS